MKMYIIISIIIVIIVSAYFLFFFKGGVKKYFNQTLIAIDKHNKISNKPPTSSIKKSRIPMFNKSKVSTILEENNDMVDFGEEANKLINDMINGITKKICNKEYTKTLPSNANDFDILSISLMKDVYFSNKFTTEEKEDYLAALSLLSASDFTIENDLVKISSTENKKSAKFIIPTLDITGDLKLTFDQFKNVNYNMIDIFINNPERYIEFEKNTRDLNLDVISLNPDNIFGGGLFNLLLLNQIIFGTKLSDEQKARMNIYIFGNTTADYDLFKNGNVFTKLFNKINGTNTNAELVIPIINFVLMFMILNNIEFETKEIISIIFPGMELTSEKENTIKTDIITPIINKINSQFEKISTPSTCELI